MKPLWIAIRPKTLIASNSPIAIGTAMAVDAGSFNLWVLLFTLLCGMGIQISCNVANDLFDFLKGEDTKNRRGPIRVTASGLMTIAQ
jgi:1,4-dihydroxy-2-naphthoate octaprenyltransferase